MRKIKKMDSKVGKTVFSFACPCASCSLSSPCDCRTYGYSSSSWKVVVTQNYNRNIGGSMVGGGG